MTGRGSAEAHHDRTRPTFREDSRHERDTLCAADAGQSRGACNPTAAATPDCRQVGNFPFILTDVHTKEGVVGHSYLEPYRVTATKSIVALIEDMAEQQLSRST